MSSFKNSFIRSRNGIRQLSYDHLTIITKDYIFTIKPQIIGGP